MTLFRTLAENLSRYIVLKRKLPRDFKSGPIFVSPGAVLGYLKTNIAAIDPLLFKAAKEWVHGGQVVWDIGANMGCLSYAAAVKVGLQGYVLAVEADCGALIYYAERADCKHIRN